MALMGAGSGVPTYLGSLRCFLALAVGCPGDQRQLLTYAWSLSRSENEGHRDSVQ